MVNRSAFALAVGLLAACTTPTLDDLLRVEVRVVRAPAAAAKARAVIAGSQREQALSARAATLLFGTPPDGEFEVLVATVDGDGTVLESLTQKANWTGAKLTIVFDFRPCESDASFARSCEVGLGECRATGLLACAADHRALACDATAGAPGAETCDGKDNDCDGHVDEAAHLSGAPACELSKGVCATARRPCLGAAGWGACDYGPDYEAHEIRCDGKDNDCDGSEDPMVGHDPKDCGGCNVPCPGEAACVRGKCVDEPMVLGSTPADGDWGVAPGAAISIRFSRAMDRPSVQAAFSLTPPATGSFSWDATSTLLEWRPTGNLARSAGYVLALSTAARDKRAVPLSAALNVSFATAPTPGLFVDGGSVNVPPHYASAEAWLLVLPPGGVPRWRLLSSAAGPGERLGGAAAFDGKRRRMLLFGGADVVGVAQADVWALARGLDGVLAWHLVAAHDASHVRAGAAVAYDDRSDALVLVGGALPGPLCFSDGLSLGLGAATPAFAALAVGSAAGEPPMRALVEPSWAWDPRARSFLVGLGTGERPAGASGCWELPTNSPGNDQTFSVTLGDLGASAVRLAAVHPSPRSGAVGAFDGQRLVVYGGEGSSGADEAWALDPGGWAKLTLSGSGPGPTRSGAFVWDEGSRRFLVFGGDSPNTAVARNGVWALAVNGTSGTWTRLAPTGDLPLARSSFAATVVPDAADFVTP